MGIKIKQTHSKEIIALDPIEAIRRAPGMYIGNVSLVEEKIPILIDNKIQFIERNWSPGFLHLIIEVLENSLDEAKRCKGSMENIDIIVNLDNNEITITDGGNGFHNAAKIHPKTNKNVVRTALEELHAGSNFTDTDSNILGTHGVGSAVTNILSEKFSVITVNKTHKVQFDWEDFVIVNEKITKKTKKDKLGTEISFIPSKEVFNDLKWDKDIIQFYLSYKAFLIKSDPIINNLSLNVIFIEEGLLNPINLNVDFIPETHIKVSNDIATVYVHESYDNSGSLSFINGSKCIGIHQKIVNDWCNDFFKYNLAHHFYETTIILNIPSQMMRFADQNKSKLDTSRLELESILDDNFKSKLIRLLKKSEISKNIENSIEDRLHSENMGKIRKAKRQSKRKITDKYSPPSRYKDSIYVTEGLSAGGSVKQSRDPESEGVYSLKGKVKNTKKLSDLSNNAEILEIMSILDIEPGSTKQPNYKKIIIAADEDPDGQHISSLIINFFNKWFPHIVSDKRLYKLLTPLVVCTYGKNRHYFYTSEEFEEFSKNKSITNLNYLKGLGSLNMEDWTYVMNNKILFQIVPDRSANKYLEIVFGSSANKRKKWLEGI